MMMKTSVVGIGLLFGVFGALLPFALLVVLQVWLCRKSARLGLILPVLSLLLSLVLVLVPLLEVLSLEQGLLLVLWLALLPELFLVQLQRYLIV